MRRTVLTTLAVLAIGGATTGILMANAQPAPPAPGIDAPAPRAHWMGWMHRGHDGPRGEWMQRMRMSLRNISPQFNCQRMVGEYMSQLYEPAHRAFSEVRSDNFRSARDKARWREQVENAWSNVDFLEIGPVPDRSVVSGQSVPMRAVVELAGLRPEDVRVEAVIGRIAANGQLEETQVMTLPPTEQHGSAFVFGKEFVPYQTGRLGYSMRISPNHYDDPLTRPCHALLKWGRQ